MLYLTIHQSSFPPPLSFSFIRLTLLTPRYWLLCLCCVRLLGLSALFLGVGYRHQGCLGVTGGCTTLCGIVGVWGERVTPYSVPFSGLVGLGRYGFTFYFSVIFFDAVLFGAVLNSSPIGFTLASKTLLISNAVCSNYYTNATI